MTRLHIYRQGSNLRIDLPRTWFWWLPPVVLTSLSYLISKAALWLQARNPWHRFPPTWTTEVLVPALVFGGFCLPFGLVFSERRLALLLTDDEVAVFHFYSLFKSTEGVTRFPRASVSGLRLATSGGGQPAMLFESEGMTRDFGEWLPRRFLPQVYAELAQSAPELTRPGSSPG